MQAIEMQRAGRLPPPWQHGAKGALHQRDVPGACGPRWAMGSPSTVAWGLWAPLAAVRAPSAAPALHEDAATLPVPCKSESSHPGGAEEGAKAITGLRASR